MPSLNVVIYHGSCRRLAQQSIRDVDVMITSYGVVASEFKKNSRNVSFLGSLSFYRIILDEAHVIRNAQSSQSKACRYAALKSEFCWCLTGTPIQNSLGDLWPIIDFLKLKPYANCQTSWKMFCGQNSEKNQFQKLKAFLNSFMLRRTHTDIELQLPECLEKIVEEKLSTTELSFYKEMEHHAKKQVSKILEKAQANQTHISNFSNILVLLLRLRQVCNHRNLLEGRFYRCKFTLLLTCSLFSHPELCLQCHSWNDFKEFQRPGI